MMYTRPHSQSAWAELSIEHGIWESVSVYQPVFMASASREVRSLRTRFNLVHSIVHFSSLFPYHHPSRRSSPSCHSRLIYSYSGIPRISRLPAFSTCLHPEAL